MPSADVGLPASPELGGEARCAAGQRCVDAEPARDPSGRVIGRVGAALTPPSTTLCPSCVRNVGYAITALPRDVTELFTLMTPSMAVRYRHPDIPAAPRIKLHAPLPIALQPLTILELIDHETGVWAASVAEASAGVCRYVEHLATPLEQRVADAAWFLKTNLSRLVELGPVEHPARSVTARRGDGHQDLRIGWGWVGDQRARYDWWTTRTGVDGALLLWDLHLQAEKLAGRTPADRVPLPCPLCRRRTLVREHHSKRVVCRSQKCPHFMSDNAYQQMAEGTVDDFNALASKLLEREEAAQ